MTPTPASNARAGQRGWSAADLAHDTSWICRLTGPEIEEIDAALATFASSGKSLVEMTKQDFPLDLTAVRLGEHLWELRNGRGFVVVRGLPVRRYTEEQAQAVFYGLGLYLGSALRQNPRGDVLGHVRDEGRTFGKMDVRGYHTNAHLPFHTDGCEIVGLLCLQRAMLGGLSSISSAVGIYNEIERTRPDLLKILTGGFRYIRREAALGSDPVTAKNIPVFGNADGVISCRFVGTQIEAAAGTLNQPLSAPAREAIDTVWALSQDDRFRLDMDLQAGDIQLVNNYVVLHSRTHYEDYPEPHRKRHMLRLWLSFEQDWPLPDGFGRGQGYQKDGLVACHLAD